MLKLIKFLSPYKGRVTAMLILLFLQVLGTLYIPTLTADIVNNGIVAGDLGPYLENWRLYVSGGFFNRLSFSGGNLSVYCHLFQDGPGHPPTHCLKNLRRSPSTSSISLAQRP